MKTKEYVKKFRLDKGWKSFNQSKFLKLMDKEFQAYLDYLRIDKSTYTRASFQNAVNQFKVKWEAISKATQYGLPESLWDYYYASHICDVRDELRGDSEK